MEDSKSFGKAVLELRRKKAMSRADLAEKARITEETLRGIETGSRAPRFQTVRKLAQALGVAPEDLNAMARQMTDGDPPADAGPPSKNRIKGPPWIKAMTLAVSILIASVASLAVALEFWQAAPYEPEFLKDPLADGRPCGFCPQLALLTGGRYKMGSAEDEEGRYPREGHRHERTIRPFLIGVTEVTRAQFGAFVRATGYSPLPCFQFLGKEWGRVDGIDWKNPDIPQGDDTHPAVCVSWTDAAAYVIWLSRETGKSYRLPSEAEWEYAARAGTTTRFSHGDDPELRELCQYGNHADRAADYSHGNMSCDDGYGRQTAPVRSFRPNGWGLYDMHGNVFEWVQDCWRPFYPNFSTGPEAWQSGDGLCDRVMRGGGWRNSQYNLRSAARAWEKYDRGSSLVGFRVARNP